MLVVCIPESCHSFELGILAFRAYHLRKNCKILQCNSSIPRPQELQDFSTSPKNCSDQFCLAAIHRICWSKAAFLPTKFLGSAAMASNAALATILLGIHAALHQRCWHLKFTWANAGHCARTQDSLQVVLWYIGLWYTDLTQPELRALCELAPTTCNRFCMITVLVWISVYAWCKGWLPSVTLGHKHNQTVTTVTWIAVASVTRETPQSSCLVVYLCIMLSR